MKRSLCFAALLSMMSTPIAAIAQATNASKQILDADTSEEAQSLSPSVLESRSRKAMLDANDFPEVKRLLDQARIVEAIQLLETQQRSNENNPNFFNLLGVLYLQQKQFSSAAAAFERVVLIQSDNAGAWLDLAIANAEAGEFAQANQFFDYIIETHKPNRQILKIIDHYRSLMQKRIDDSKPWSNLVEFAVGHDTNANSGLLASHITVTFEGKEIDLPLDSYKAQSDTFRQLTSRSHFQTALLGQNFAFDASLSNRSFTKAHGYSYTDATLGMSLSHSYPWFDLGLGGNVEHFIWGNRSLLNNSEVSVFLEKNLGTCHLTYVLDYESRRYVAATHLNARSLWSNLAGSCHGSFLNQYQWDGAIVARRANDKPIVFRAGGSTSRQENIIRFGVRAPSKLRADLSFSFGRAADSEGYSALLDNNAKRFIQRRNYRLQLSYPLGKDLTSFVAYEDSRNDSNLVLFKQRARNISAGLRLNY